MLGPEFGVVAVKLSDKRLLPLILPLGDSAILVRFADRLDDTANRAAIALARALEAEPVSGVVEIVPNLVSVLLRYNPEQADPGAISGELRLRLSEPAKAAEPAESWAILTVFDGPDVESVAALLGLSPDDFVAAHNGMPLRVLATGFAPGFVYCGMHGADLVVPRRASVRSSVAAGSILFAAGQTALTATELPTGWHVIGRTDFRNFDSMSASPTRLKAGDSVRFVTA